MTRTEETLLTEYLPDAAEIERIAMASDRLEVEWLPDFPLHLEKLELRYEPKAYLFLAAFPQLAASDLAELSLALRFVLYSTLLTDKLVDRAEDLGESAQQLMRTQAMQFESYRLLYGLFPPNAQFWQRYKTYLHDFAQACLDERRFARGEYPWQDFDDERALGIIRGKNRLALLLASSMAELASDDSQHSKLSEAVEKHYCAWQLWDDLCDWKEDFLSGTPSLLLSRVVNELPPEDGREAWLPILGRKIYYEGHAVEILGRAVNYLDEAELAVADIPGLGWRQVIADLRSKCVALGKDLQRIVTKNLLRARQQWNFELGERPPAGGAQDHAETMAWRALEYLVDQWHLGFDEVQHVAHMPHALGYRGSTEFPSGDVFQRALIADALCDADEWLDGRLEKLLTHEVDYLLSQRSDSPTGGWRYFPSILELAPDADDLGQIMQVLLRTGRRDAIDEYCERPLSVLLEDARYRGGPFSTWIIPMEDRDEVEAIQAKLRGENWGPGPDVEVMANLLYPLAIYDAERFTDVLAPAMDHIEAHQAEDGSWASKWYFGPFYGTYVCLRLLAVARPDSPSIAAAKAFLWDAQREDGGWGWRTESDPSSTALALLGATVEVPGPSVQADVRVDRIQQALVYLDGQRDKDGAWPSVPFISIPVYGSRTVCTLYVLRACLACRKHLGS